MGFVIIGGSLVWEIEHTTDRAFANFGDAVWWAFSTMTTIGYGPGPATVPGRHQGGKATAIGVGRSLMAMHSSPGNTRRPSSGSSQSVARSTSTTRTRGLRRAIPG